MSEFESDTPTHSPTGASGAYRWMNCPGSVNLIRKLSDGMKSNAGEEAARGTAAHTMLSECLTKKEEPWEWTGKFIPVEGWTDFEATIEMVNAVTLAYDFIQEQINRDSAEWMIEKRLCHPDKPDEIFGTTDFAVIHYGKKPSLTIIDYKNGYIIVEPTSPQLKYYAFLIWTELSRKDRLWYDNLDIEINMFIVQPRARHVQGPIRKHVITVKELLHWAHTELFPALERTKDENALLVTGTWCRFCPARDMCPAIKSTLLEIDISREPEELTGEEIGVLLDKGEALKKYLERLQEIAYEKARKGDYIKGYKLVKKKANRIWKEEIKIDGKDVKFADAVIAKFGADAYKPAEIKTPPNIEKLPEGKKFVTTWAFSPEVGLTLARDSDSRERIKPHIENFMDRFDASVDLND